MTDGKQFVVVVPPGTPPQQIDDFPKGCVRSKEQSALYISPGTYIFTDDEIKHIRKHHKDLARRMQVVQEMVSKSTKRRVEVQMDSKAEVQMDPKAVSSEPKTAALKGKKSKK